MCKEQIESKLEDLMKSAETFARVLIFYYLNEHISKTWQENQGEYIDKEIENILAGINLSDGFWRERMETECNGLIANIKDREMDKIIGCSCAIGCMKCLGMSSRDFR